MNKGLFLRFFVCIVFLGFCLYSYLNEQNEITDLRIKIPALTQEVRRIDEENTHLQYEIEQFESPGNLMQLARQSVFSHLKFPICNEVLTFHQTDPLGESPVKVALERRRKPTITFATGANP